ncbi:DUF7860 family protein [Halopiger xanaduensis]|uniref:Uncharacterized protein n=1 Tax=Halopiger xanaduensis (strain DSM 18323 / JCM 14033 / SH-6) TaxID=797210 RepID=F8D8N7_HALXS|nr:hypothetical protein [Halopiger xanaduensis]AEH36789.1 hypothetical protein Halxa_2164 [Halopiger xanaduensis SH-6]
MQQRYGDLDYPFLTKAGFLFGVGLLALGAAAELIGHAVVGELPGWEDRLFTYSEALGILIAFFSVWIFGIYLPLTE